MNYTLDELKYDYAIITGAPGSGKSTTIGFIKEFVPETIELSIVDLPKLFVKDYVNFEYYDKDLVRKLIYDLKTRLEEFDNICTKAIIEDINYYTSIGKFPVVNIRTKNDINRVYETMKNEHNKIGCLIIVRDKTAESKCLKDPSTPDDLEACGAEHYNLPIKTFYILNDSTLIKLNEAVEKIVINLTKNNMATIELLDNENKRLEELEKKVDSILKLIENKYKQGE